MIEEGARVAYVGHLPMLAVGDEGVAVDVGHTGTHVRWVTGSRQGSIDLIRNADLVTANGDDLAITRASRMRQDAVTEGWGLESGPEGTGIDDDELGWI